MVIDGHAHASGDYLKVESITEYLSRNNADKVVLVPGELNSSKTYYLPHLSKTFTKVNFVRWTNILTKTIINISGKAEEIKKGNHYVFELTRQCPEKIFQFFWVTQFIKDLYNELEAKYLIWKFKGLKLHQCWENFSVDSDYFRTTAELAEKHDLPLFIHLWNDKEVQLMIKYKQSHSNLKLIIGHMFGIELFFDKGKRYENIFFEISSPQLISGYRLKRAINHLGSERFILGSDTPYGMNNLNLNIKRINDLPISQNDKDSILGKTMKYLLKI